MQVLKKALQSVIILALFSALTPYPCRAAEGTPSAQAQRILEASGVTGGIIVHLGCGDGALTAALSRSGQFIVHGLGSDAKTINKARENLYKKGVYGRTSLGRLSGGSLPYIDNMINLIVVDKALGTDREEWMRVLAPLGVLMERQGSTWKKTVKAWPENIDEWTHYLHGPDNNAVARDSVVGPPQDLQWIAAPRHLRSHEHLNSLSALVSTRGRIFFIIDEGPVSSVAAKPQWRLVARDAFNGALLWKRDIGPWEGHFRLFRSGPTEIARRLVADGERVYATLGYGKKVAAFDAATGETVLTYEGTEGALEILYENGRLYILAGTIDQEAWDKAADLFLATPEPRHKSVLALDAKSGKLLWKVQDNLTNAILPTTLAVNEGKVFFQNTQQVICLNAATGDFQWCADRPVYTTRLSWSTPTLVVRDGVVLSADGATGGTTAARRGEEDVEWIMSDRDIRKHPDGDVVALNAETGEPIWSDKSLQGFCSPGDVFVIDGRVWAGAKVGTGNQTLDVALDLKSGEVRSRVTERAPAAGHTRCYRNKATERFLLTGGIGVEFIDVDDWSFTSDPWVRGSCQYGIMPCNGLLYAPPDSCACRPNARLHGFTAMAPERKSPKSKSQSTKNNERLEKGPLYGKPEFISTIQRQLPSGHWPSYRNDSARSGSTKAKISSQLKPAWSAKIGGRLSAPTVSWDKVFVSEFDAHTIHAIDKKTGEIAWSRTVGGPVDSPPTISPIDTLLFGCRDGWVYSLRASNGEMVWRFRAAPEEKMILAHENIESAWPVNGSVLLRDGQVWFAAGRSAFLDDGLRLIALDIETGALVVEKKLDGRDAEAWPFFKSSKSRGFKDAAPGTFPDILSAKGEHIFMGWSCFDGKGEIQDVLEPHLFSATSFLDDTWWHRTYWQYGSWMSGGFGGWPRAANAAPAGRLLVFNDKAIFGFGREKYDVGNPNGTHAGHVGVIKDTYQDSGRVDHSQNQQRLFSTAKPVAGKKGKPQTNWLTPVPLLVRAMVLADETLWIAGPDEEENNAGLAKIKTVQPGRLWAVSTSEGKKLAEYNLPASPVSDGMAATDGQIFVSCTDGAVRCLSER